MMIRHRLISMAAFAAFFIVCSHSFAQWQVPDHSIPIGRGAGITGFKNALPPSTAGIPLIGQGSAVDPAFGTAVVAGGGTGATSFTNHGILLGQGTNPFAATTVMTNGQLLIGQTGADPAPHTMSQDCTLSNAGVITCTKTNNVNFGAFATGTDSANLTNLGVDMSASGGLHVGAFSGDVTKSAASLATTVTAVQGNAYQNTTYSNGQVPTWSTANSRFEPATPSGGGGGADYNIVTDGGAKCDYAVSLGSMASGSSTLINAAPGFAAGDVGKYIAVQGAGSGGTNLYTTIATFVNSTTVTLSSPNASGGTISGKYIEWGTDDTTAINNSIVAAQAAHKNVYVPPGQCLASRINLTNVGNLIFHGAGMGLSQIFPLQHSSYGTPQGHLFDMTGASYVQVRDLQIGAFYELAKPTTAFFQAQVPTGACNVQTLGPNLYVTGSFTYNTIYNYGCPSSSYSFVQLYNYYESSTGVVRLSGSNSASLSSSFTTVATGAQSTSDLLFLKAELHNFSGSNISSSAVVNIDNASTTTFVGGNITGGAQYYVLLSTASHISFDPGVTFETESQPTPSYVFAVGSAPGTIKDISYPPLDGTNAIYGTGVWTSAPTPVNRVTNNY